ncbi:MAG: transcription antitermination factor NusB [Pseudomonadota bacterium]
MTAHADTSEKKGNKRSTARLGAVQALYQMDTAASDVEATVQEFEQFRLGKEAGGAEYAPADFGFFRDIVRGVVREQLKLDPEIDDALLGDWPLERVDMTLRQILRCGLYEILFRKDVPYKAVIAEYVDIAEAFFDKSEEVRLANAVLDGLARKHRAAEFS